MITPTEMLHRMGINGGLVPFFKCVCLYFVVAPPSEDGPSFSAVSAKCSPVFCLLLFTVLHPPPPHVRDQGWYKRRIAVGLGLSMLGDGLLMWPQHFIAGMAAFAAAHVAYIASFGFRPLALYIGVACHLSAALFMLVLDPPGVLAYLVPLYSSLLATMTWRGVARGGRAAFGAVLFLASDAILAYSMFAGIVPHKQALVMSTYYLGQLSIALSALEPTPAR